MQKGLAKILLIAVVLFGLVALNGFTAVRSVHAQVPGNASSLDKSAEDTSFQAAALGIKPGMADANGQIPTISMESGSVQPDSASGCNKDVCIYVTGSGLHVSKWETTAYFSSGSCSIAAFWVNHRLTHTSDLICHPTGGWYHYTWSNPGNFADNTKVCNTWTHRDGEPCETVHS